MDEADPLVDTSQRSVTVLLRQASAGDLKAKEALFEVVQRELRVIAEKQMRGERSDHSLQTTVLVDDAFLRLVGDEAKVSFANRKHFYRTAARAMRRLLIDHERQRRAQRRGGGEYQRAAVDLSRLSREETPLDLLALDEALTKLAGFDPRQSEVVELHHFGGCTLQETAELVGVSIGTVKADWKIAKAWLHRELSSDDEQA